MSSKREGILLGHTAKRERITVDVELWEQPGTHKTITGGTIDRPLRLGITGTKYKPHGRRPDTAGQISDTLGELQSLAPGWTIDRIGTLRRIWEEWHLNTLRPGGPDEWLTAPLPIEVEWFARNLIMDN